MQAIAIILGLLAGPALLLILARHLCGMTLVHRIWRWGLRWIYLLALSTPVLALIYVAALGGFKGDDRLEFFGVVVQVTVIAVSGAITLATYKLLTREPDD